MPAGDEAPAEVNEAQPSTTEARDRTEADYTTSYSSDEYGTYEDPYGYPSVAVTETPKPEPALPAPPPPTPPAAPASEPEEDDEEDEGMLRMSFLEHLEELRSRIIRTLAGIGIAFVVSLVFAERLWVIVSAPATGALLSLGFKEPKLAQLTPMETFNVVWVKLPLLAAIFLSSPWVIYQVWAFIAPGLYKKERRWAAPFVLVSAGLFILGGLFAYFVAFRFGLTFLLGIGRDINILPLVSVSEYFDLFVNVTLGVGIIFELPVLIFFLTLLRIVSPRWLLSNARYAILVIVLLAAVITPTPDIYNLMLFSVPMVLLFFVGVYASYLLVLGRERNRFPWLAFLIPLAVPVLLAGAAIYLAVAKYGYSLVLRWPFLVR